ncbi:MAG: DUF29 domain-containing protein [Oscillatoria princeps RMCB-10]|jgi:hypothetical protein|nr:DUF29 domain-containing protein [Oscillatoria princeps RMCB-10]
MPAQQDWEWLAACSHYQTAVAVRQLLGEGQFMEATEGLDALIEAMGRTEKRALKSQLTRLMSHVIKWKCQPERRSSSWAITIRSARREIRAIQEEVPSLNRNFIESIWDTCFSDAVEDAEDEMGRDCELISLSREEVFDEEYSLLKRN